MDEELKKAKEQFNEVLCTFLNRMIVGTRSKKIEWTSTNESKFYYTLDEKFAIEFKIEKNDPVHNVYNLKIIQPDISKINEISNINSNDGEIYQKANDLYTEICNNQIQNKKGLMESFLKELK